MSGGDQLRTAHWQLAMVLLDDALLHGCFHIPTESIANRGIQPAIHDAEAVGRTDEGVRVLGKEVAVTGFDLRMRGEGLAPGSHQRLEVVHQNDPCWKCHTRPLLRQFRWHSWLARCG